MSKPRPNPAKTAGPSQDRAVSVIRAAGGTTIVAGGLAILSVFLTALLAPSRPEPMVIVSTVAAGGILVLLGVLTLRRQTWCIWVTMAVMALILGVQLWMAYGSGRTPRGQSLSLFLLIVPLVVLIANTLAAGMARSLEDKP